ncbi:MAG: phospholipid carrier-dependent glycosyltransferase [Steroidobacteraceae bacterium]
MSAAQARAERLRWWAWVLLAAIWFATLQIRPMFDPDEGRYAEIPREMLVTGNWVTPRLDGLKYFEKPALQYWATASVYSVFGVSNWSSRLWTVGLGFGCLALIYAWLARLYDRRAAIAAVALLAMSPYFGIIGHLDLLDAGLCFWLTAMVLAFTRAQCATPGSGTERNWMLVSWAMAALALLTKGLEVYVLAGLALISYSALERDARPWRRLHLLTGIPLMVLIGAPWFVVVSLRNPAFAHYFFIDQHFERFLTDRARRVEPWWYFIALLVIGAFAWLVPLARAARAAWRDPGPVPHFKPLKFLLLYSLLTVIFFSISDSKLATYILPIFPPIAALTGVYLTRRPGALARTAWVAAGLATFVAVGLLVYSHHRNGFIPPHAIGWGAAAVAAALVAVVVSALGARREVRAAEAGGGSVAVPLAVTAAFIFVWQALLCQYAVIPPSRSAYQLVQQIRHDVHPDTALYSVQQYRQTIPPYLGRLLTLVDYKGELGAGERWQPGLMSATPAQFVRQWKASRDAVAFFPPSVWRRYRQEGLPGRVIGRDSFTVAVSRQ